MANSPKCDENTWLKQLPPEDIDIMAKGCDLGGARCPVWFDSTSIIK